MPLDDEIVFRYEMLELLQKINNNVSAIPARFTARDLTGKDVVVITKSRRCYKGDVFLQEASGIWINCKEARESDNKEFPFDGEVFLPLSAIESLTFTG